MKPRYKPARRLSAIVIEQMLAKQGLTRATFVDWFHAAQTLPPDPDLVTREDADGWTITTRGVDAT